MNFYEFNSQFLENFTNTVATKLENIFAKCSGWICIRSISITLFSKTLILHQIILFEITIPLFYKNLEFVKISIL